MILVYLLLASLIWNISVPLKPAYIATLKKVNALDRMWPVDPGFWSLRWVAIRRFIAAIITGVLVRRLSIPVLSTVLLWLNLLYSCLIVWVQFKRVLAYCRSTPDSRLFLRPVVASCIALAIYAIWVQVALYISL